MTNRIEFFSMALTCITLKLKIVEIKEINDYFFLFITLRSLLQTRTGKHIIANLTAVNSIVSIKSLARNKKWTYLE